MGDMDNLWSDSLPMPSVKFFESLLVADRERPWWSFLLMRSAGSHKVPLGGGCRRPAAEHSPHPSCQVHQSSSG